MKFICSQAALFKAVNTVSKAVSLRTTIPILKGILLSVKNNRLTLSASDLDMSIESYIDVQASEDGSTVVSAKIFGEIIRKLPNALVMCELSDDGKFKINCLDSEFFILALFADEFPVIKGTVSKSLINIKKDIFTDLISKTNFAASIDEKRGILTGCLMNFENSVLELVALDGCRMAVASAEVNTDTDKKIIVPSRILGEVNKILREEEGNEISIIIEDKKIEILTEESRIIARLLEGEFIRYRDIIPASYKTRVVVGREDILSSIERASLLAKEGKNNLIKISAEDGKVYVTSRSEEGNVNEKLSADISGDNIIIGFNSKYLVDILKAVNEEEIAFEMGTSVSSCVIRPAEGSSYLYLVLPVRISAA